MNISRVLMFISSLLLASCAATPREPGPPQVIFIDRVGSLSEIKGVALNIYLEDGWTLERESDHMLTFISENPDFVARVFLGTQYDTRVFYREHLVIAPTSDGVTLRTSQSLVSNLGSSFERAAPVEGLGGKRLLKIKSVLMSAPQSVPLSSAPRSVPLSSAPRSAAIGTEEQAALTSLAAGAATLTKLTLTSGYGVAMQEARAVVNWKRLYNDNRWAELALSVMKVNSGSNLAWFYLGRCAEGLGYKEAAAKYYKNSIETSKKNSFRLVLVASASSFQPSLYRVFRRCKSNNFFRLQAADGG